jgi:hypothetical protein
MDRSIPPAMRSSAIAMVSIPTTEICWSTAMMLSIVVNRGLIIDTTSKSAMMIRPSNSR